MGALDGDRMRKLIFVTCMGSALWSAIVAAAEVKVFSAGAVDPGLQRAAEQFKRASGNEIKMQFNTALNSNSVPNVCLWHKADITNTLNHVRFRG